MKDQYASDYYDFLQSIRDQEDELTQRDKRKKKAGDKRLRELTRALDASVSAMENGVPKEEIAALWLGYAKQDPSWKPIAKLLFGKSN